jgi:hypothetical protein
MQEDIQNIPLPGEDDNNVAPDFLKERGWYDVDVSGLLLDFT